MFVTIIRRRRVAATQTRFTSPVTIAPSNARLYPVQNDYKSGFVNLVCVAETVNRLGMAATRLRRIMVPTTAIMTTTVAALVIPIPVARIMTSSTSPTSLAIMTNYSLTFVNSILYIF